MKKLLLLITILLSSFLQAQNLFQDTFNSYTTGVDLSGQGSWTNNSSLPGGAGTASNSGPGATKVVSTSMTYLNYGTSINSCDIKINSDATGRAFTPVTTGDIFVSFVLNLATVQANNNSDFFRVLSADNFNTSFRLYAIPSGGGFVLGTAKGANGNAISFTTTVLNLNVDHLVVFKYSQFSGTNDDVVSLYVDPIYASGIPAIASATTSTGNDQAGNVDRLNFRQNWTNGMPTGRHGLTSVARTWEELTFLPLALTNFNTTTFSIIATSLKQGSLAIKSNLDFKNASISIYDIQGRKIHKSNVAINAGSNDFNVTPILNSGIYIVEITTDNNQKFTQKIAIN